MGLPHAAAMVVGIIIGASIFVQPTEVSRYVPSIVGIFAVWTISGLLTLAGAMVCAELSSAFPQTGGVYVFLNETISPAAGFLWAWAMFWIVHSGIIAAVAIIFGRYLAYFAPLGDAGIRSAAIAGILLLSFVNLLGVRQGSRVQAFLTAAKLLAILVILAAVVFFAKPEVSPAQSPAQPLSIDNFALAVGAGLFAFGGWHIVTYAAGETRQPEKTIPRALVIGTLMVTVCYLALNAVCLYLLPLDRVISSQRVAADAAGVMLGNRGAATVSALVLLSSLGVLNGMILAGPRLYLAVADRYRAFHWMGGIHPRFRTPQVAIAIQAAWACVLAGTGTYRELFSRVIYTEWIFFALMAAGLMRMHRHQGYAPGFRVPAYPFVPVLFLTASLAVACYQVAADPLRAGVGLLLVVLGLPLYCLWVRKHAR